MRRKNKQRQKETDQNRNTRYVKKKTNRCRQTEREIQTLNRRKIHINKRDISYNIQTDIYTQKRKRETHRQTEREKVTHN